MKREHSVVVLVLAGLASAPAFAGGGRGPNTGWEIWASDQSNSVSGITDRGVAGSYIWIWDSVDVQAQLAGGAAAPPLGCSPNPNVPGPCDVNDVFPSTLVEVDETGTPTGDLLGDLPAFGRLHGMIADPQHRYVSVNLFAPGGGYVGIMDVRTRSAIGLWRVTGTDVAGADSRTVHMSFWNDDGSSLLVANLNGKVLERIDVTRSPSGRITDAVFDRSASLGVGKGMAITSSATAFTGNNQRGRALLSRVGGAYTTQGFDDLTPNGVCKENGCAAGVDGSAGGRPNNVIICPIASDNDNVYVTMGGGGLLVADAAATPMTIVGEYGNQMVNGAGCGGVQTGNDMWLNAGVSASGAGATWSTFTMYAIDDTGFGPMGGYGAFNPENTPAPWVVFEDPANTNTGGFSGGASSADNSGQLPGVTTRRDAHGAVATIDDAYIHNVDRIQNNVEVFDATTGARTTYDLTSADGQGSGMGPCDAASVFDDPSLPSNDPAPDLMDATPDGQYLITALRGPTPVSVTHSAQGSCPGVGIIELTNGGASGRLVGVLRSTNYVDTAPVSAPGGHAYVGGEHSDVHGAIVVRKSAQANRGGHRPGRGHGRGHGHGNGHGHP